MSTASPMHARLPKAVSIVGCASGRQHRHYSALKEKRGSQDKVTRQRNKQLLSLGSRTTVAPVWMQNNSSIAPSHKTVFLIVGHFLWKHKRNPSTWQKSLNAKKIEKQEPRQSSPHLVCFTVEVTKRHWPQTSSADVTGCQLQWFQEEKTACCCHTRVREGWQRTPLNWPPKCDCHQGLMAHIAIQHSSDLVVSTGLSPNMNCL